MNDAHSVPSKPKPDSVAPQLARVATVYTAADGSALLVDSCWKEQTGLDAAASMDAGWLAAVHPDDVRLLESALREAGRRQVSLGAKLRLRHHGGGYKWMRAHVHVRFDDDGLVVSFCETRPDGTDPSKDEALLLRRVLQTVPVGVWVIDKRGSVLQVNPAAETIWQGVRYVHKEDYASVYKGWWADTGQPLQASDWPAVKALQGQVTTGDLVEIEAFDGKRKVIRCAGAPITDDEGAIVGAIVLEQDITAAYKAEAGLRKSEFLLRKVLETLPVGVWLMDACGTIVSSNPAGRRIWAGARYVGPECFGEYKGWWAATGEPIAAEDWAAARAIRQGQTSIDELILIQCFDGGQRYILNSAAPLHDDEHGLMGAIIVNQDVDELVRTRQERSLLADIVASTGDAIYSKNLAGRITSWNQSAERMFGYAAAEVLEQSVHLLALPGQQPQQEALLAQVAKGTACHLETQRRRKDGSVVDVALSLSPIRDCTGKVMGISAIARDISERKRAERQLEYQATHDMVTGLPNRSLLRDRCQQAMRAAERRGAHCALLFLDLDGFKYVNDCFGHDAGDSLLQMVAERLKRCVRAADTVARLGGDEFVVLQTDLDGEQDATVLARRLLKAVKDPFYVMGTELTATASIGVALFPRDALTVTELLKNADAAMYQAKEEGKNTYRYFSPDLNRKALERLVSENRLRKAIEREEFVLFYQPQVDAQHGRIFGVEVLMRWRQPENGLLLPDKFIPIAEETGLIVPMGEWVLKHACKQVSTWRRERGVDLQVAVNLSARQFADAGLVKAVQAALVESGLPAHCLELELTESVLMRDPQQAGRTLEAFKSLGTRLSIDDFGTGYSSLTYLQCLPIDKLKIDRSFVAGIPGNERNAAIAGAVVDLGHRLGMKVIAEGVETAEQLACLRAMGCDEIQGYYFGRPVDAQTLEKILSQPRLAALAQAETDVVLMQPSMAPKG